ncbi:Cyclin Clg1 [Schizosaccharomyces pombe]
MSFPYQHTSRSQVQPPLAAPGLSMFAPVSSSNSANSASSVAALLSHAPMYGLGQRRPSFLPGVSVPDTLSVRSGFSIPSSSHHPSAVPSLLSQHRLQQPQPRLYPSAPLNYYWPSYQSVPSAAPPPPSQQRYMPDSAVAYNPNQDQFGNSVNVSAACNNVSAPLIANNCAPSFYQSRQPVADVPVTNNTATTTSEADNTIPGNLNMPSVANVQQRISPVCETNMEDQEETVYTGGVAAKLDYKMDQMVEYLSIMTCKLYARFLNNAQMHSLANSLPGLVFSFRKVVTQILTSTRLPRASCLLALSYLSDRLDAASQTTDFVNQWTKESLFFQICALLTTALILANKFLDDNTFTNQSWSQVTGFRTALLNSFEQDWLASMSWNLSPGPRGQKAWEWWSASYSLFTSSNATYSGEQKTYSPTTLSTNAPPSPSSGRSCSNCNYYYPYTPVGYYPVYNRYAMT